MTAVDFSFARPSPSALTSAGVTAVGRYLTGTGKAISPSELQSYLAEKISVWLAFENTTDDYAGGKAAGTQNASAANQALTRIGLPIDTPVYFTVDTDLTDPYQASPYFQGIAQIRPVASVGCYGEGALLTLLKSEELITYGWQSESTAFTGNASTVSAANIQQSTAAPPLSPASDFDLDLLLTADYGQVPRPTDPPSAPEGGEMIAYDPVTKGYWCVRPSGDIYAYDGAPDLGPGPEHIKQWQIGTGSAVGPVVGIVSDGAGGYTIAADNGDYPGQPALYHIPLPPAGQASPYVS